MATINASEATVIVIGAGLAGLSAASYLTDHRMKALLLEASNVIGGRTASWNESGMEIETGLHRFLGFYNHLPDLLKKSGINLDAMLCWEDEIEIRLPNGPSAVLGLAPLHKPLKTITGILGNSDFLSAQEKLALLRFFAAGAKDYIFHPRQLDSMTVLQYAKRHHVPDSAIQKLLIPLTEGIFFLPIASYSAFVLFSLFIPYWKSLYKLRVGAFTGGMSNVMAQPIADAIINHGGELLTGQRVTHIEPLGGRFIVHTSSDSHRADAVILAASLWPAQEIIQKSFPDPWFDPMLRLHTMPSVTFQIELSEPCMELDRTTFGPNTSMAAFTEQSRTTFRSSAGRLSVILSPPHTYMHMEPDDILDIVIKDARDLGIELEPNIIDYRKVVIPHDFYQLSPGAEKLRPPQKTPIAGLFLAGDYTKQKYLVTMEGAVFSGKVAARLAASYVRKNNRG